MTVAGADVAVAGAPFAAHRVLGIETSCDETAAAVLLDGRHIASSWCRARSTCMPASGALCRARRPRHVDLLTPVVAESPRRGGPHGADIDAVAVTWGPASWAPCWWG